MLLKVDDGETQEGEEPKANKAGYTEFISHTTWAHQMDFEEWKKRYDGGVGRSTIVPLRKVSRYRPAVVKALSHTN